jgi:hypothetical protein
MVVMLGAATIVPLKEALAVWAGELLSFTVIE